MPFIVGVLRNSLPGLKKLSERGALEQEVIIFDIDNDRYLSEVTTQDFDLLPHKWINPLVASVAASSRVVKNAHSLRRKIKSLRPKKETGIEGFNPKDLWNPFIALLVDLTTSYRRFILLEEVNGMYGFQQEDFFLAQPPELQPVRSEQCEQRANTILSI